MNAPISHARQLVGSQIHPQQRDFLDPAARRRIEEADDTRLRLLVSRPPSRDLQLQHSIPELNFVANVSEFYSKQQNELQWVIYGVRRTNEAECSPSAHVCGIVGMRGLFIPPTEMTHVRPSRVPGLPPEIASKSQPKHYGDALEIILDYIETILAPTSRSRPSQWF